MPAEVPLGPGRRGVRLLVDRDIGPYFAARLVSSIGIWIHNVVAAVVVFQLSGSVTLVALVSVAQFSPQIALAPLGGALADRWDRRIQASAGRLAAALGAGSLALLIVLGGMERLRAWHLIAAAFVVGLGFAMSIPALQALVPSLAARSELTAVVTLDTIPATVARAAGPAAGSLLLVTGGPGLAFGMAALSQALLATVLWCIRFRPVRRSRNVDRSTLSGVRHLRVDPSLAVMLLGVTGIGLGVDPAVTLAPPLAAELGTGARDATTLTLAFGLGAVAAAMAMGPVRRRWPGATQGVGGLSILAAALLLVAVSPGPALAVAELFVGGFGMFMGITGFTAAIQARLPEDLRGRIMALWSVGFLGSRPLSATINGVVADAFGVHSAFVVMGLVLAAIAGLGWWRVWLDARA